MDVVPAAQRAAPPTPGRRATAPPPAATPPDPVSPAVSIEDVYTAHRTAVLRLAVLLVDDRASAEDVVQDAFAGLHRAWPTLAGTDRAVAYLRVAVVNGARSALRRRRTARAWVAPHARPHASAEEEALLSQERRDVLDALRALPPRQREVLVLRYWSGLDEAGIAAAMGVARGTVKSTASRGLAALERALADGGAAEAPPGAAPRSAARTTRRPR